MSPDAEGLPDELLALLEELPPLELADADASLVDEEEEDEAEEDEEDDDEADDALIIELA